jgi:hypothetical protein
MAELAKNKMNFALAFERDRCQVVRAGQTSSPFEIKTPVFEVVRCKIDGEGTLGGRYAKELKKAEYYMQLKAINDEGKEFLTSLNQLQKDVFKAWFKENGTFKSIKSSGGGVEDVLDTLKPIADLSDSFRTKRKVCRWQNEVLPMPFYLLEDGVDAASAKRSDYTKTTPQPGSVRQGDLVQAYVSFFPWNFHGKQGLSVQLRGVFKVASGKCEEKSTQAALGIDWMLWSTLKGTRRHDEEPEQVSKKATKNDFTFSIW